MKIRLKWILTAAVALFAAIVVAVFAILASLELGDLRGVIEAAAKDATGRSLRIGGPMDLKVSLAPTITIENVTFENAPWGAWPEFLAIRRLEVEVRLLPLLTGEIEVRRLAAIEPTIFLETDAEGQGNWVIGGPQADTSENTDMTLIPAFHRIEVRGGSVIFRDGQSGQETLVTLQSLEAEAETPASPSSVALRGAYNGVAFSAAGIFGSRDELLSGGSFPLDLNLQMGETTLRASGAIATLAALRGVDLEIELQGKRLSDLDPLVGEGLPALGPYTLKGRLSDTERGIALAGLAVTLGDSDFTGNATVEFDGARPIVTATLNSNALDIGDFLGRERVATEANQVPRGAAEEAAKAARVFSDEPLLLDALLNFDARIKLSADQAQVAEKTMIADLSFAFELNVGKLTLRDFKGILSGGNVTGELTLDAAEFGPPFRIDLQAKDFDYGRFLQGRDVTDGVKGTLDAQVHLSGAGMSPHAWAKSLDGRVTLTGGKGRVRSDLLAATGAGLLDVVSAWREGEDDLNLNCVVMRLPVEDGVMKAEAVLIDTATVTVGVSGEVNLGDETLDLKVSPQAKQASLMSLAIPVRIGGTLAEPSVGPDALGTVLGAAKIAGMFINPLVAGAAIILESQLTADNPCVAAIEAATEAPAVPKKAAGSEGLGQGISKEIKNLFKD